jgi:branched-chain amino acid transport system substrate-binding protein
VTEVNTAGGIAGRPLQIRWVDDDASGIRAVPVAESLVADRTVLAVIGHESSAAMLAAARVYDGQMAAVSPSATSPDLSGISHWVFRITPSDSTNGQALARFALALGARRIAVLYENDAYARGLAHAFRRHVADRALISEPIPTSAPTYEPYIAYLKRLNPDLVFVAGLEGSGLGLLREAKRQGLTAPFLGGNGWAGVEQDTVASEGVYVGLPFTAGDERPEVRRFVASFAGRFRVVPREDAALAYDATRLLVEAIRAGGATRVGIRAYLASLGPDRPFEGVTGRLRFQATGDPVGQSFITTRVHRGAYLLADSH